jgi:hypothetical protein
MLNSSPATKILYFFYSSTNQVHAEHDLLVWYEICELESNGE